MAHRSGWRSLQQMWQIIADLLFPPQCVGCQRAGVLLCDNCLSSVGRFSEPRCARCDLPLTSSRFSTCVPCTQNVSSTLDGLRVVGPYDEPLRAIIHALKYLGRTTLAAPMGALLAERWNATSCTVDGLLPVPLHPRRQRERGFNQSEVLAWAMAASTGLPVRTELLQRVKATRPQVGLAREERLENVAGAFVASPLVRGGRWLLVDDVCTTSATLEASAAALRAQGATAVWALTLARPQNPARDLQAERIDGG